MDTNINVALAGNPNVGKSTLFNALTGMNQHTGNWTGKTIESAKGYIRYNNKCYTLYDLPGTYSLYSQSPEEAVAKDYIESTEPHKVIIVCDATCLKRNLILTLQMLSITKNVIVCLNLMDEAKKKGIEIQYKKIEEILDVPVIPMSARSKKGLSGLLKALESDRPSAFVPPSDPEEICTLAENITKATVHHTKQALSSDMKLDGVLIGKYTAYPVMLLLFGFLLWTTISGANYPSAVLSNLFDRFYIALSNCLHDIGCPSYILMPLMDGIYKISAWIVSVMLPPMAIFFPLFTLLEDFGYLPRIAFNLDKFFQKACTCGKQALTMCMGLGCNAVGVTGCRIINSERERLIAILTNTFMPCNGRFPMLITITCLFFAGGMNRSAIGAASLLCLIVLSVCITLAVSKLLSKTCLKGLPSAFTLELPSYRMPQFGKVLVRSVFDRTLFVLCRALMVAAPAGLFIWLIANIRIGSCSILFHIAGFLDPIGTLMGLDGAILLAFILGCPANEIVIPLLLMIYTSAGNLSEAESNMQILQTLTANGWTIKTAVSFLLFTIMHWPCATTLLTAYKETKSLKWTLLSFLIPTALGVAICTLWNGIYSIFLILIH